MRPSRLNVSTSQPVPSHTIPPPSAEGRLALKSPRSLLFLHFSRQLTNSRHSSPALQASSNPPLSVAEPSLAALFPLASRPLQHVRQGALARPARPPPFELGLGGRWCTLFPPLHLRSTSFGHLHPCDIRYRAGCWRPSRIHRGSGLSPTENGGTAFRRRAQVETQS